MVDIIPVLWYNKKTRFLKYYFYYNDKAGKYKQRKGAFAAAKVDIGTKIKMKKQDSHRSNGRLLLEFMRGSKLLFLVGILTSLAVTAADMLNPQLIRFTVDKVLRDESGEVPSYVSVIVEAMGGADAIRAGLWKMALLIVCVALAAGVFRYLQRIFNTKASETLVEHMRNMLYEKIQSLPFAWHMKNKTGDIIQRCTSDVDMVKNFLSEQLMSILRIVIQVTVSLVVMYGMDTKLALAATLTLPVIFAYSAIFGRRIGAGFKECDEADGALSAIAQENLTGVRVVRAFGREKYERERFRKQNGHYRDLYLKLSKYMSAFWGMSDLITGLQVMMMIVMGVYACLDGRLTAGSFIAFITYNSMLTWPMRRLGRMVSEMSKAGIAIDRLGYIMHSEPERDREGACEPDMHRDICFEDVSFAYEGCPELLSHISFTVPAGSTVGILGGTGSGKSTLVHLLDRLYELPADGSGGRITIGGVDVADISAAHLRRNIGIVLQEPYLFSRSIAENIAIASPGAGMDEIREAARVACLDETVSGFAEGYDTFVGERGVTLSGGQKQRTAIARMLTERAPIMVFDDSLSAVDAETDAKIRAALSDKLGGSTVFLISHRTATLMGADNIIVLDHGRIAECGTHEELVEKDGGIYRRIFEIQMSDPDDAPKGDRDDLGEVGA